MSTSVASDFETPRPSHRGGAEKAAILAAKLLVTGACFWYISRQIDLSQVLSAIPLLDIRWAALAILVVMLEIPLAGLRWYNIVDALGARNQQMTRAAMIAATAAGLFFAQVLPSVAGEGVRAWLLVRLGSNWRNAVTSALIDRGVGVGLLIVLGFVILLLPSGLAALGGYRDVVLVVYGTLIFVGALGLLLAPKIVPPLARWRYSRWFATLAADVRRVLLGRKGPLILSTGSLLHALTIIIVWSVGRVAGPRATAPRRGGLVHGHDRCGTRPDLDRRLGPAGARRGLSPRHPWRRAGKSVAVFGVLRPRAGDWLAAWSAGLALVSVRVRSTFSQARRVKGET
jgi:hypothetical protein